MNLAKLPRRRYTTDFTPLEYLPHFSQMLSGPSIYLKRDDLLGLTAGGNKTRKLEFIIADAIEKGADTIITCGGIQSNHCRLTLSAAIKENLKCMLILEEGFSNKLEPDFNGNFFLFHLLGAENIKVVANGSNLLEEMELVAEQLEKEGRNPYIIPVGGSNAIGATGYASCAQEILAQSFEQGINIDAVVCVSGSGGMQAGLVTGFHGSQSIIPVIGMNVSRGKAEQEEKVYKLVQETAAHIGLPTGVPRDAVTCIDEYVGPGYALPTPDMIEAVKLIAKVEGIILDPVYTGKALAGLIDLIRKGKFKQEDNIVFVHSGGAPALYASAELFKNEDN